MFRNAVSYAQIADGIKFIDNNIDDGAGYADAINGASKADPNQPGEVLAKAAVNATPYIDDVNCEAVYNSDTKQFDYHFHHVFLPASRTGCGRAGVLAFFDVTKGATFGNTVQYLYNPKVGAN